MSTTISKTITTTATLGSSSYPGPLIVLNTGEIDPSGTGVIGVYAPAGVTDPSLTSDGIVLGGTGAPGTAGLLGLGGTPGGTGGMGVDLAATNAQVDNTGNISGGAGGTGANAVAGLLGLLAPTAGGDGGIGLHDLAGGISLTNSGAITGGSGGAGGGSALGVASPGVNGGAGGIALDIANGANAANTGTITGGAGGTGGNVGLGVLSNEGDGGNGGVGVYLNGGTFINAGTVEGGAGGAGSITGTVGDAILFGSTASTLIVDPGADFVGTVAADSAVADVLELSGSSSVALAGIGTQFTGFNNFSFAAGASWDVGGTYTGFASGQTISGFTSGDTIVLDGFAANTADVTYVSGSGLELTDGTSTITLDIAGSYTTADFVVTDPPGSTTIAAAPSIPCYLAGTLIETGNGPVPVETLKAGDHVRTLDGLLKPVKWIGWRRIEAGRHPRHDHLRPVFIAAGALGDGLPGRDLIVSFGHAVYFDRHLVPGLDEGGCLIPAHVLINGHSVHHVDIPDFVYYHVELPSHDVIFAEGMPCETYLDTGNRGLFENADGPVNLHPDFSMAIRGAQACAPVHEFGPAAEAVRAMVLARAAIPITRDPAISVRYIEGRGAIIQSRSAVPGHVTPDPRDRRELGIKIAGLTAGGRPIPIDHPGLTEGWHHLEPSGRWTNGRALVPQSLLNDSNNLDILVADTVPYVHAMVGPGMTVRFDLAPDSSGRFEQTARHTHAASAPKHLDQNQTASRRQPSRIGKGSARKAPRKRREALMPELSGTEPAGSVARQGSA